MPIVYKSLDFIKVMTSEWAGERGDDDNKTVGNPVFQNFFSSKK